jgi:peptide/nickel transport system ATP-binding protein
MVSEINPAGILLSIRDLRAALPATRDRSFAVKDISLDLHAGEMLCIIGESGSGKSVTANALMGLLPRQVKLESGEITFQGRDLLKCSEEQLRDIRGRSIAMIFQDPMSALNPLMTVGKQIEEAIRSHRKTAPQELRQRVVGLLADVGLPDPETIQHQYPFRMSGGQRQRVMIAMAMALGPDILIADEPTTALDVTTQAQILSLIKELQGRKNMGVIFITHDFGIVEEVADRVVVMRRGEIVEQGPASKLLRDPQHAYTRALIDAVPKIKKGKDGATKDATPAVMEVRNLHKTYEAPGGFFQKRRTIPALKNVSFDIHCGRTVGIVGESGSGKSTLARQIVRLAENTSGSIVFMGRDIAKLSENELRPVRRHMQMIFQDPYSSLNPRQTIGQILLAGPRANGMAPDVARERAMRLLERVGLDQSAFERYPHEFSGGQRQRAGIARALMMDPILLVADESVSALDVSIQAEVLALLKEIQAESGVAIVFITHDLRVAHEISDELIVMYKGEIVESGPTDQVFWHPKHDYTKKLLGAVPGMTAHDAFLQPASR